VFWVEYQSLTDVMNFYRCDPLKVLGLKTGEKPLVRIIRIRQMLDPGTYRRFRLNVYRLHCQFVSGNDRRAAYDYFMLLCGPLPVEAQGRLPDGGVSALGDDGSLLYSASGNFAPAASEQVCRS